MRVPFRKALFLLTLLSSISELNAYAKDFGKYGATTTIKEEGFIAMIMRKLKALDMDKERQKMLETAQSKIDEPPRVEGIIGTTKARSFTFDPTYILKEDIHAADGSLLHPMGTKVNPLDHMDFDRKILFLDARDAHQVAWLNDEIAEHKASIKDFNELVAEEPQQAQKQAEAEKQSAERLIVVLVAGRPLGLQESIKKVVYFDQNGELTSRFGIRQVPCKVAQEGKLLRIEEVKLTKKKGRS